MKILTTSTDAQELKVIPRNYVSTITVKLRNESTNAVTTDTGISATTDKGYLVFSNNYTLTENIFYELEILDGLNIIYKDKIFCTDQTLPTYTVNKDEYTTENSYNNDYIII